MRKSLTANVVLVEVTGTRASRAEEEDVDGEAAGGEEDGEKSGSRLHLRAATCGQRTGSQ